MKMEKRLRQAALLAIAMITSFTMLAQQKTITGKVLDPDSRPLQGVTVMVKGKTTATTTNENGDFSISAAEGDVLSFSSIGFTDYQEKVGAGNSVSITLAAAITSMNEVVVVGYGTLQKKDITGSIVSVKTENLPQAANASINNLLQGRAAGLNLSLASAQPGGRLNVNVRGGGAPLYVIDGVPIFNNRAAEPSIRSVGASSEIGFSGGIDRDPLSTLNPYDIESIDVLKDASAAAIYGSAAANGVILITTKRGKGDGKVTTAYQGSYTIQSPKEYFELLNAKEFMQQQVRLAKDQFMNVNNLPPYGTSTATPVFTPRFTQAEIDAAGEGTDWLDILMRNGQIQEHNITVSGGTAKTKLYTSFNYVNNTAILENSDFVRYAGRVNLDQQISDRIKLSIELTMSQINSNNASTGPGGQGEKFNSLQAAYAFSPAVGIFGADGKYTRTLNTQITNPAAFLIIDDKLRTNRFFASPNIEFKILDNLKFNVKGGIDRTSADRKLYVPTKVQNFLFPDGMAQLSKQIVSNFSVEGYATYNTNFGDHSLSIVGGGGYYKSFNEDNSIQGAGFFTDALGYDNIGLATNTARTFIQSFRSPDIIKISQYFRANYSYKSKYIFTLNARHDGSSSFAANKKWGFFPGVAAAWRVSQESFMANSKIISDLKLRAGYGTVGNDAGLNAIALYKAGPTDVGTFLIGNTLYPGVALGQLENPDLTWETIRSINIGLDWAILDDRISGTIDVFRRDRLDILTTVPLPANNAVSTLNVNLGSQRSQGIEFAITSKNFVGAFQWETSFNISNYKTWWTERSPYVALQPYQNPDDRTDIVYGWQTNGIIQTIADRPAYMPNSRLGNVIFTDQNKDGLLNVADVVRLGYSTPKWSYGMSNRLSYKNVDLSFFIYGRLKQYMSNNLSGFFDPLRIGVPQGLNTLTDIMNVWSIDNPGGFYPGVAQNPYSGANPSGTTNFYMENVNFLRFRDITLGYTFSAKKVIRSARVFVQMQNLGLITNYKGYDPEIAEGNPYPQTLSTSIGVNLSF